VDRDAVLHGETGPTRVASTVGAGDALLAGFLAGVVGSAGGPDRDEARGAGGESLPGIGGDPRVALAEALAWARVACRSVGTAVERVTELDRVGITISSAIDPHRRLRP
jgi:1-phosphofructokinase